MQVDWGLVTRPYHDASKQTDQAALQTAGKGERVGVEEEKRQMGAARVHGGVHL